MSTPTSDLQRSRNGRMSRAHPGRRLVFVLVGALVIAAACSNATDGRSAGTTNPKAGGQPGPGGVASPNLQLTSALQPFGACDQLLDYVKKAAVERVGPYGLPNDQGLDGVMPATGAAESRPGSTPRGAQSGPPTPTAPVTTARSSGGPPVPGAPSATPAPSTSGQGAPSENRPASGDSAKSAGAPPAAQTDPNSPTYSETNVQEKGVDEPDTVKTDGKRLLAISGNRLIVVDVSGPAPQNLGSIALPGGGAPQILWKGNHVLVLDANATIPTDKVSAESIRQPVAGTLLSLLDITNPADMKILNTVRVDGQFVSARMVDGQARVVTSSAPSRLPFVNPSSGTAAAEQAAENANKRIVEDSKVEDWLPSIHIGNGANPTVKPLLDCARVNRPKTFSGFGVLSVVSVDVNANEVNPADAVGVMADGQTVYASKTNLYVTTPAYADPPVRHATSGTTPTTRAPAPIPLKNSTSVHKFDIAGKGPAVYRASGAFDGDVLNQFSLSEDEGSLRVATTTAPVGSRGCRGCSGTETFVRVLQENNGELTEVGAVGNMGRGEQVKSVRFVGKQGYVVTFRQTDPLYTLNLADPKAPKVVGELKVLGYSAYLHPAGENLIIGVGQDATETGRAKGTQVALYDVSDLANPRELQKYVLLNSTSEIEQAFHAFMWWEPTKLAMIPVDRAYVGFIAGNCPGGPTPLPNQGAPNQGVPSPGACPQTYIPPFTGAIGLTVDRNGISELGRVVNPGGSVSPPCRASGVAGGCESPCPPDAMCTGARVDTGGGRPSAPIDCSKESCGPTTTSSVPATTVPCPANADCVVPPRPTPPCAEPNRPGGGVSYCPSDVGSRIERSLVVGDTVFTFSSNGLKSSELSTLREKYWLPFA